MASPSASIRIHTHALLRGLDTSATHLSTILSTAVGTDKFLLTVYYTLKLLYPQLTRLRTFRLRHHPHSAAVQLKTSSPSGPPGTVLSIVHADALDAGLSSVDAGMRALAGTVGDVRIFLRLWGLLAVYGWARGTYTAQKREKLDAVVKVCTWGQIGACAAYQILENVAYLAGKGVFKGEWVNARRQGKMWLWSCRFWLLHCSLEVVRLLRVRELAKAQADRLGEEKEDKIVRKGAEAAWTRAWYSNAAYTPMALHYSVSDGLLSDDGLGFLGVVVSWNTFWHMWKTTPVDA